MKSKSKTFPKGTDISEIGDFITEQVNTDLIDGRHYAFDAIKEKVLITIVKYPEKDENTTGM
jgi:hypothetical protein